MLPDSKKITVAADPCVTPDQMAAQLNMGALDDDAAEQLALYISAAEDAVSREIKRPLGICTAIFSYPASAFDSLEIAFDPVIEITGVSIDGEASAYTFDNGRVFPRVVLDAEPDDPESRIEVTAEVGYETVPNALKVAVMMLAAGMYEHRMDVAEAVCPDNPAFQRLIAAYKQEFAY